MKTRSKPVTTQRMDVPSSSTVKLEDDKNPPRLIVLPTTASKQAAIVTLAHPRTCALTKYYFCPETGLYEFTKSSAPKTSYKSWLLSPVEKALSESNEGSTELHNHDGSSETEHSNITEGYLFRSSELFVTTPIDPMFLLLPVLSSERTSPKNNSSKPPFLSADDIFDNVAVLARHFTHVVGDAPIRGLLISRLSAICDSVDAGDEHMYRLSNTKLLHELIKKAKRMVSHGLPPSMEERFVRRALEVPILAVKRQESTMSETANGSELQQSLAMTNTEESQSSAVSTVESQISLDTTITTPDISSDHQSSTTEDLHQLLRLRTSLSYMLSAYIPAHLASELEPAVKSSASGVDFSILEEHLARIAKLRAEAQASQSMLNMSLKRAIDENDEEIAGRAEKKRKKEEEEKKKKSGESRALKNLKKADTTGMKKMSDFFGRAAAKTK